MSTKKISVWVIVSILLVLLCGCSNASADAYDEAIRFFLSEEYESALSEFESLGDYKSSSEFCKNCKYYIALEEYQFGNYDSAEALLRELGEFKDCMELCDNCLIYKALSDYRNDSDLDGTLEILFSIDNDLSRNVIDMLQYEWINNPDGEFQKKVSETVAYSSAYTSTYTSTVSSSIFAGGFSIDYNDENLVAMDNCCNEVQSLYEAYLAAFIRSDYTYSDSFQAVDNALKDVVNYGGGLFNKANYVIFLTSKLGWTSSEYNLDTYKELWVALDSALSASHASFSNVLPD